MTKLPTDDAMACFETWFLFKNSSIHKHIDIIMSLKIDFWKSFEKLLDKIIVLQKNH